MGVTCGGRKTPTTAFRVGASGWAKLGSLSCWHVIGHVHRARNGIGRRVVGLGPGDRDRDVL